MNLKDYITLDIELKIEKILSEVSLTPEVSPYTFMQKTQGIKHRYYSVCSDRQNEKKFFYALVNTYPEFKTVFINELLLANELTKKKNNTLNFFPQYIKTSDTNSDVPWIICDYIPYSSLEDGKVTEKLSKKVSTIEIRSISETIFNLNKATSIITDIKEKLQIFDFEKEYTGIFNNLRKQTLIDPLVASDIQNFMQTYSTLVKKETNYLTHGDLHLGNIITFTHDTKIETKIIDWERYHINNVAFDVAFLFFKTPFEFEFRNSIIKQYINYLSSEEVKKFTILFRFNILYFVLKFGLDQNFINPNEAENEKKRQWQVSRASWFKNLITNALNSFEKVIETSA